jgi:Dolichyl-phosphate-mannose-protein mannosyltransferase
MSKTVAGERGPSGLTERLEALAIGRALDWPRSATWIVAALTALALGLRLACIDQSLFGDELFLWAIVDDHSLRQVFSMVHDTEKTPPLGFVLSWVPARLSETPELVRLPSFIASVATVPLVYMLGLRTVGRAAAVVAAAWCALSPFQIFYGTESRSYAVVAAFVILSTLALLAALEDRKLRWWTLYALAAAAAVYTHYIAVLSLVPQAAWALWTHRDRVREQLIWGGLAALAFLPWVPSFIVQLRHSADEARRINEVAPLTFSNVVDFTVEPLVSRPWTPLSDLPGRVPLVVLGAILAGVVIALLVGVRIRTRTLRVTLATPRGLVALLALAPLIGLVLYSLRPNTSFLLSRNLAAAVPYALLLVGWLLTYPRSRLAAVLSAAALAALAVGTFKTITPDYQRPDAREAARYIDAHAPPNAPVVDVPGPHAIRTYLQGSRPVYTISDFGSADWAAAARAGSRVFLTAPRVAFWVGALRPPAGYERRYRLVAERDSPGVPFGLALREYAPR